MVGDFEAASKVGRFMSAVSTFLRTNNPAGLREFEGASVTDLSGQDLPLRDPAKRSLSARISSRPELRAHLPHRHLRHVIMNDHELKRERRRQRALERLGMNNPRCVVCGYDDPLALELHHIAGRAHGDELVPVCRNCHRPLSDMQKDHPAAVTSRPAI